MEIDIRTLIIILVFTHIMQVVVFYHQYKVNKNYNGLGWWLMWSAFETLGFIAVLFRNIPSILPLIIVLQNTFIVGGTFFLYIGIKRFFGKKINFKIIIAANVLFLLSLLFFIFVSNNMQMRSVLTSGTLAIVSFVTAFSLFVDKKPELKTSAYFNGIIFLIHGLIFLYRTIALAFEPEMGDFFTSSLFNILPYFDALIVSLLWTFGLVIMVNQNLILEVFETKDKLQLIFNTSPDAAIITRVTDGLIIDTNEGYSTITGYSPEEIKGKTTNSINIWKNFEDRRKVIEKIREFGYCENFEAQFVLKSGQEITGLMSAKEIKLDGVPHIISITRDITDRKKIDEAFIESELRFRMLFENMAESVAICEIVCSENGDAIDYRVISINKSFCKTFDTTPEKVEGRLATEIVSLKKLPYLREFFEVTKSGKPLTFEAHSEATNQFHYISVVSFENHLFAALILDITEQKQKEAEIKELLISSEHSRINLLSILEDQIQAEKALQKSEEKYRLLADNTEEWVYWIDNEGFLRYISPSCEKITGFSPAEFVLNTDLLKEIIIHQDLENFTLHEQEARFSESVGNLEFRIITKTKEIKWIQHNCSPMYAENGAYLGQKITNRNITLQKLAEEKTKHEQMLMNNLIDSLPGIFYMYSYPELTLIKYNRNHELMLGYEIGEMQNFSIPNIRHDETRIALTAAAEKAMRDGQVRAETNLVTKKGIFITFLITGIRIEVDGKSFIMGVGTDISERKNAEEAVNRHAERLQNLHRIDQVILQAIESPENILQHALTHVQNMISCQHSQVAIFNFTKNEVQIIDSSSDGTLKIQNERVLSGHLQHELNELVKSRIEIIEDTEQYKPILKIEKIQLPSETRSSVVVALVTSQGTYLVLSVGWVLPREINQEDTDIVSEVASQITIAIEQAHLLRETKTYAVELEQRVAERTQQLENSNKELEAFSYSVSHDLRAPLRHINGFIKLFLENKTTQLTEEELNYLKVVTDSSEEMGKLIDALLSFSRLQRSELEKSEIDTAYIINRNLLLFSTEIANRNIEIIIGPLEKSFADLQLLNQVWMNLLSNAIKYTSKCSQPIIEIGSYFEKNESIFFVKDNGAGFNMKYAEKLFGVFQRLHKPRDFEGIGIGLANVHRIISKHGGRCWAQGEVDKGATFYFSLPFFENS